MSHYQDQEARAAASPMATMVPRAPQGHPKRHYPPETGGTQPVTAPSRCHHGQAAMAWGPSAVPPWHRTGLEGQEHPKVPWLWGADSERDHGRGLAHSLH